MTAGQMCKGASLLKGFSMLEIMLVTALVAVLLSLAVPAYESLSLRSHRSEAISALMQGAACQERQRVVTGSYSIGECQVSASDRYQYETTSDTEPTNLGFRITASPLGRQAIDHCGAISLDHNGFHSVENPQADVTRCWSGR